MKTKNGFLLLLVILSFFLLTPNLIFCQAEELTEEPSPDPVQNSTSSLIRNSGSIPDQNADQILRSNTRGRRTKNKKIIRGFNIQAENDVISGLIGIKNGDKDYTGGFKFEFYTDYLNFGFLGFLKNKTERTSDKKGTYRNYNSIYFQGMGYTPVRDAFSSLVPVEDQRPYASVVSIGKRRVAFFKKLDSSIETDFRIGQIGLQGPGELQNFFHEYVTNSQIVMGWDNQIGNGGRWIYNFRIRSTLNILAVTKEIGKLGNEDFMKSVDVKKHKIKVFVSPHYSWGNLFKNHGVELSLSNRPILSKGLITSMGSGSIGFNETGYQSIKDGGNFKGILKNLCSHFSWDIYGRYYKVKHNTLLQGLPFYDDSIYTISDEDMEDFVYDIGFKVLFNFFPEGKIFTGGNNFTRNSTLYFEVIRRSKEFSYHQFHIYGNIGITVSFLNGGHIYQ